MLKSRAFLSSISLVFALANGLFVSHLTPTLAQQRATETIYHLNAPSVGEAYHLLAAMEIDPDSYIYLGEYSGISDPAQHGIDLQNSIQEETTAYERAKREHERYIEEVFEYIHTGEGHDQYPGYTRQELRRVVQNKRLPKEMKKRLKTLRIAAEKKEKSLRRLKRRFLIHRNSRSVAGLLKEARLEDRIIDTPATLSKTGETVESLIRKPLPNKKGVFQTPRREAINESTTRIAKALQGSEAPIFRSQMQQALLGHQRSVPQEVVDFVNQRIPKSIQDGAIIWIRQEDYYPNRNINEDVFLRLIDEFEKKGKKVVAMGHSIPKTWTTAKTRMLSGSHFDLTQHWKNPIFGNPNTGIRNQVWLVKHLNDIGVISEQVGMVSGIMDAPGFLGIKTKALYFAGEPGDMDTVNHRRIQKLADAIGESYQIVEIPRTTTAVGAFRPQCVAEGLHRMVAK